MTLWDRNLRQQQHDANVKPATNKELASFARGCKWLCIIVALYIAVYVLAHWFGFSQGWTL